MKFHIVFFCLLLLTCTCQCFAQGPYGNCCLGHAKKIRNVTRRNIESFIIQETDGDCNIRAVVFQVKKRPSEEKPRTICANPDASWVQDLVRIVEKRMALQK